MHYPNPSNAAQASIALDHAKRLESATAPATVDQILGQMRALVERVMGEAALYAPEHAAIAVKQASGDSEEAAAILRAFRTSLETRYTSDTLDTANMPLERRISSAFREIPAGQILGATRDYTQRLLDETIAQETAASAAAYSESIDNELSAGLAETPLPESYTRVVDLLKSQGLLREVDHQEDLSPVNINRVPISFPAHRSAALQTLARGETGALMALGYSAMRGQGGDHPTIGELRVGNASLRVTDRRGRGRRHIGTIRVTESNNISKIKVRKKDPIPYMSIGYGLCFGQNETKAICMGILDRSMRIPGDGAPAVSQEFVLYHVEGPDSHGYVNSLKLPAYTEMATEIQDLRAAIARHQEDTQRQALETAQR